MCHRVSPLLIEELREALRELEASGHPRVPPREAGVVVPDCYPGKQLPLFVPRDSGGLEAVELMWGFDNPVKDARSKYVFNTRIETALAQMRSGRGLWAEPIRTGRCLVPVLGFFESWTRSAPRRGAQVSFGYPGHRVFLLAGVYAEDRVSIMTTEPNGAVAPYHSRMPLVLAPGESSLWLDGDFATLGDRSSIVLSAEPEQPANQVLMGL